MSMVAATTTLQRTYRYLRIATAGTVVVILVAVVVAIPVVGLLPSISHYFYTPARNGFVGAMVAASVCLFVLSGRGPSRVILDTAALFVPLIAFVPTMIGPGTVPGVPAEGCSAACIPPSYLGDVDNGVITYLIVGAGIVAVGGVLAVFDRDSRTGTVLSLGVGAVVLVVIAVTWGFFRPAFLEYGHLVAAVTFFTLIAAFAVLDAVWPSQLHPAPSWLRITYLVIAGLLVLDLIATIAVVLTGSAAGGYLVLIGEVVALVLFAVFWVLQSVQKWDDPNPSLR